MFAKIKTIKAYEVLDSRGYPTVCCVVETDSGAIGKAMVPSGASTGEREALELRDGDKKRYNGKGVLRAVDNVNKIIAPVLIDKNVDHQTELDNIMMQLDGTEFKTKLGANAILSVSLACAHAAAKYHKKPLYQYIREDVLEKATDKIIYKMPVPMANVINGGQHADNTIDFQEFMFMPVGARSFRHAIQIGSECFHALQKILKDKGMNTNKGDEGGFAPLLKNAEEVLDIMVEAIKAAGYTPGTDKDVSIALDCACSELYDKDKKVYVFEKAIKAKILDEQHGTKTTDQMIDYLESLVKKYPIISIEDGLAEND
jgi:enolase